MADKPTLTLLSGDATAAEVLALFRHLTGREPSPEEVERVLQKFAARDRPESTRPLKRK